MTDSRSQAISRGELGHAYRQDPAALNHIAEIGEIVAGTVKGRLSAQAITVATFSGLAVQDVAIGSAVLARA